MGQDRVEDQVEHISVEHISVEYVSAEAFGPTLARLERAIEGAGMTILARIDHAAGAREVGLAMPPTIVLLYGNPRGGTPIMLAAPSVALDLPLRVLLREDRAGRVLVSYHPILKVLRAAGVPDDLALRLDAAQHQLFEHEALKEIRS